MAGRGEHVHGLDTRDDAGVRTLGFGIVEGQQECQGLVVARVWLQWCGEVREGRGGRREGEVRR